MAGSRLSTSLLWLLLMTLFNLITFTNNNLHSLRNDKPSLPPKVYHALRELSICAVKPTRRGHRSWAKQHKKPIPVLRKIPVCSVQRNKQPPTTKPNGACLKNLIHLTPHVDSNLHFCSLNVQSIRNKTADFVHEYSLDIVAISETWLKPGDDWIITEITPPGYSFHHIPRLHKTGGGVGLLYKSSLSARQHENIPL